MSQNTRTFDPKLNWDSDTDNLIEDFYKKAVANCVQYDRMAGYFSSTSFALIMKEALDFIEGGGIMRLVTSHQLTKKDQQQLKNATEKPEEILSRNIIAELSAETNPDLTKCVEVMGYMLANNQLQIKIAVPDSRRENPHAIFHKKTGIFYLENNGVKEMVSFNGSNNESGGGWKDNDEDFTCFKSWHTDKTHAEGISGHTKEFEKYWNDNARSTSVYELPDAIKKALIKGGAENKEDFKKTCEWIKNSSIYKTQVFAPWDCQIAARDAVVNAGYNGIIKMATGTGKTRTALIIFKQFFRDKNPTGNRILIIVPTAAVGEQWKTELFATKNQNDAVYLYHSGTSREDKKYAEADWTTVPSSGNSFLIILSSSIDGFPFKGKKPDLLVADEVHGYGTENIMNTITNNFAGVPCKLGLSATPERFYDKPGTKRIFDFFGGIVYQLCLKTAQKQRKKSGEEMILSQYFYEVSFVDLTDDEEQSVEYWTKKIGKNMGNEEENSDEAIEREASGLSSAAEKACIQRSKVCKKAVNKMEKLREILKKEDKNITQCLIYCAEVKQSDQAEEIFKQEGINDYVKYNYTIKGKEASLRLFKQSHARYIISVDGLNEGVDIQDCNTLILLSSSTNPREFIQRRGRVIRNPPGGKPAVKIFDISALPKRYNEGYAGLIKGRLLQVWEFIDASRSKQEQAKIDSIRNKYQISINDLQTEIEKWCKD